ncbi:MAG: DMT family transporter [Henriciella sp.]|nr:DMT family transporter [Henriciella sp.]
MSTHKSASDRLPAWAGALIVLAGGICIGFAPIGMRFAYSDLGPHAIAFWRFAFAAPILFGLALLAQRRLPSRPNKFIIIAGICFGVEIALWHMALTLTSVANSTFIVGLGNLCVGLTAWAVIGQRPGATWGIAATIAILGAAALSFGGAESALSNWRGDLLALGAAILVSFYMVFSKLARGQGLTGIEAIFWLTAVEVFVAAAFVIATGESFLPETAQGFIAPLALALIVQVAGQALIIIGLGHTSAAIAGVLIVVQPVVAAALAWRLFGEPLSGLQGAGAVLILIGIVLAQTGKQGTASKSSPDMVKAPES